jgi:hypothetical protein
MIRDPLSPELHTLLHFSFMKNRFFAGDAKLKDFCVLGARPFPAPRDRYHEGGFQGGAQRGSGG